MEELKPLTLSRSIVGAPSVLLTSDLRKFTIHSPLSREMVVGNHLLSLMSSHFKLAKPNLATFSLQGKRYLCIENCVDLNPFDVWYAYSWDSKQKFNQYFRPRTLFESFLFDMYFPLWGSPLPKYIHSDKKDRFGIGALPENDFDRIIFQPLSLSQLGMDRIEIRRFFSFIESDLNEVIEEFLALHHDKFQRDVKYAVSLYPEERNRIWDEVKKCFDPQFRRFVRAQLDNYVMRLM
jgi:hypothetical protein